MNIANWLDRAARRWPDRPALMHGKEAVASYRSFAERAIDLARLLGQEYGFAAGDRAAIYAANSVDYLIQLYAVWYSGGVVVPINAKLHMREAAWIITDADARLAFIDDKAKVAELTEYCNELGASPAFRAPTAARDDAPARAEPTTPVFRSKDDLAWLFYTSGTTGRPKGVAITHAMLVAMSLSYLADVDDVFGDDAALYAAPLSHGAGMYNFVHVLRGARHVVPISRGFDPEEIAALAPELGSVHMFAAPTMVTRMLATARKIGWRGEGLRTVVYGGGPMYLADIEAALDWFGDRFVQIYGQGECPMAITSLPRAVLADRAVDTWRSRAASVGIPQSAVDVMIADADGQKLPVGEVGEVMVRGAPVMAGYWRDGAQSSAAFNNGWLVTGDRGYLDPDGYLTLKDRSKDVIISGGTNIYPREVEEVLLTHPAVREVAVIGEPNRDWGECVVAVVVTETGSEIDAATLDAHCRKFMAGFKRPKRYRFLSSLPKNAYGKILKRELRTTRGR